jgi:hypothetical protein
MRSIAPRTGAVEVTLGEDQLEFSPVVAALYEHESGATVFLTRWRPSDEEREALANGGDIYIGQLRPKGELFAPLAVSAFDEGWTVPENENGE